MTGGVAVRRHEVTVEPWSRLAGQKQKLMRVWAPPGPHVGRARVSESTLRDSERVRGLPAQLPVDWFRARRCRLRLEARLPR